MDLNLAKARDNARKHRTTEKLNMIKSKGGARGGGEMPKRSSQESEGV